MRKTYHPTFSQTTQATFAPGGMRVVHVVESFGGGVIGFVIKLIEQLPDVQHVVVHAEREGEVDPAVTRARFPAQVRFILWPHAVREVAFASDIRALGSLIRILRNLEGHVVHLHSSKAGFLGRVACAYLGRKAVCYTPNGAAFLREDIPARKRALYLQLEKVAARLPGIVVACGATEAAAFKQAGIGVEQINNGTLVPAGPKATPGLHKPLRVVTVGRITAQKGPALFADIATRTQQLHPGAFDFTWIGEGELAALLPDTVRITGWQRAAQVAELLATADVYLSTALWEGLPFAVLEGMGAGLPLLLHDCAGNRDLVDGANGRLFTQPQEAVAVLMGWANSPEALARAGRASFALVASTFNVEGMAAHYRALYQRLAHVGAYKPALI